MNDALLFLHVFLILSVLIYAGYKEDSAVRRYFFIGSFLKICCGLLLGCLYKYYYGNGDVIGYYNDGVTLSNLFFDDPGRYLQVLADTRYSDPIWLKLQLLDPRASFFSKFVSVINVIDGNNFWVTSVYFSLIAFAGAWFLFKTITAIFPYHRFNAALALLFYPSVVFWTSGLIKESVASATLFYLTALFLLAWQRGRLPFVKAVVGVLSLWILWGLKYYFVAVFMPVVFTAIAYKFFFQPYLKPTNFFREVLLWLMILIVPLALVTLTQPNFYFENFLNVIVENYNAFARLSTAKEMIHYTNLEPTPISIVLNSPWALCSGLFRPLFFEGDSILHFIAGVENFILLLIFLFSLKNVKEIVNSENRMLLFATIVYVTVLCTFLALSTPNFGTLARYRIGYMPYFVLVITAQNPLVALFRKAMRLVS